MISLVWTVATGIPSAADASAKMTAKKNKTATAMPPSIVIAFIIMFGVVASDLKLILAGKNLSLCG